jgi:hypothetical protein
MRLVCSGKGEEQDCFTSPSRLRVGRDTVWALTVSPTILTMRPTCRVDSPRRKASRISIITSGARRSNRFNASGRKLFSRIRATRNTSVPIKLTNFRP